MCSGIISPLSLIERPLHRDLIHENRRGFGRSRMPNYALHVVMWVNVNFLHKNSHREWFGGLKQILITILSIWLCTLSMANSFSEWRWNVCDQHDWITLFGSQIMYVTFQDCPIVSRPINDYEWKRYSKNDYECKRNSTNDYECKRYSKNDYESKR